MPTIKEKVSAVFQDRAGQTFSRQEIIDLVVREYPDTRPASIRPSNYCYNLVNKSQKFDFHLFEWLGPGQYRCLGENYPYTGAILWQGGAIGEWQNGELYFW